MSSRRDKVQAILDITSQEVASLGVSERRAVFSALAQAESELTRGLRSWLRAVPDGDSRFTARQMRIALANVSQALETMGTLEPAMDQALRKVRGKASIMSGLHVTKQLSELSFIFDRELRPINLNVIASIARGNKLLVAVHKKSAARYGQTAIDYVKRQLAVGMIKGESIHQMTKRVQGLAVREASGQASRMASGLMKVPYSSASRLVRTEAINAYNTYHLESLRELRKDDPEVKKVWDSSLDRRGCIVCRRLDGEVREVEEQFHTGVMHPVQHPYCRCTVVPWFPDWEHASRPSAGTEGIDAPDPKPLDLRR